jgi:hypothetical protein
MVLHLKKWEELIWQLWLEMFVQFYVFTVVIMEKFQVSYAWWFIDCKIVETNRFGYWYPYCTENRLKISIQYWQKKVLPIKIAIDDVENCIDSQPCKRVCNTYRVGHVKALHIWLLCALERHLCGACLSICSSDRPCQGWSGPEWELTGTAQSSAPR